MEICLNFHDGLTGEKDYSPFFCYLFKGVSKASNLAM
jgi:hypothetical protein